MSTYMLEYKLHKPKHDAKKSVPIDLRIKTTNRLKYKPGYRYKYIHNQC